MFDHETQGAHDPPRPVGGRRSPQRALRHRLFRVAFADYADPSQFIDPSVPGFALNSLGADARRYRAAASPRHRPTLRGEQRLRAYGQLDTKLTRRVAPVVAFATVTAHDFFSARIGLPELPAVLRHGPRRSLHQAPMSTGSPPAGPCDSARVPLPIEHDAGHPSSLHKSANTPLFGGRARPGSLPHVGDCQRIERPLQRARVGREARVPQGRDIGAGALMIRQILVRVQAGPCAELDAPPPLAVLRGSRGP